jgi:hypothetical protein
MCAYTHTHAGGCAGLRQVLRPKFCALLVHTSFLVPPFSFLLSLLFLSLLSSLFSYLSSLLSHLSSLISLLSSLLSPLSALRSLLSFLSLLALGFSPFSLCPAQTDMDQVFFTRLFQRGGTGSRRTRHCLQVCRYALCLCLCAVGLNCPVGRLLPSLVLRLGRASRTH